MKKFFVILFTFIICLFLIFLIYKFSISNKENDNLISINNKIEENITEIVDENILEETSQEERKISYKATIILNKYYKDCNHTITSSVEVPYDMVNMSKEDIEKNYPGWRIVEFSENEVSLFKEFEGMCNEHYLVEIEDGYIVVYNLNEDNEKKLYEKTDIDVEYLTNEDREELSKGINVIGYSSLNALLENYE